MRLKFKGLSWDSVWEERFHWKVKLVAVYLVHHQLPEGFSWVPSIERIAKATSLDEDDVQGALTALSADGWIVATRDSA